MAENKKVIVRVKRQAGPKDAPRWEEFALDWRPSMNVIICLRDIAERPVTRDGKATTPVSYESNCLEEVCGSCAMVINGKARMACSALVDLLEQPIRLEPMTKFPVVRDLAVDRSVMFENLKRVKAWIPIDGTYDLGEGPRMAPDRHHARPGTSRSRDGSGGRSRLRQRAELCSNLPERHSADGVHRRSESPGHQAGDFRLADGIETFAPSDGGNNASRNCLAGSRRVRWGGPGEYAIREG